ncbi:hypothetical protein BX666DRAFT_1884019 [Dichotomocladium elegans]|nr:hypothetical protein BX666DRAFT_1884019 [Dichotomocladium elegans]
MELTSDALKELGITAYGRRYRILHALESLKNDARLTPPVSPSSPLEGTNGESLYQFPRKAPAPPRDSFRTISPSSSTSMSRSNTFRTISSKISNSSSYNGNTTDKASCHKTSLENTPTVDLAPYPPPPPPPALRESLSADDISIGQTVSLPSRSNDSTALLDTSVDAFAAPEQEGWLHKQGDKYKTWNKRWFVLKGPNLFYFKSPKDTRVRGIIHLRGYRVVVDESIYPGRYSFKAQHEHERTFYFYTDTKESMRTWLKALMKATITRDFTAPVMSSNHVTTVPLDVARQLRPRPPSKMLHSGQPHITSHSSAPPVPFHPDLSSTLEAVLSDDDEDLIDPMHHPQPVKQVPLSTRKLTSREKYISWINRQLPPDCHTDSLANVFRDGDALIRLLESLSKKSVRRQPIQPTESANMVALDNMVAAFKFMGREGVVVDGNYTIKDVFSGDEEKIMNMLDAIISWSEKNGFAATV